MQRIINIYLWKWADAGEGRAGINSIETYVLEPQGHFYISAATAEFIPIFFYVFCQYL